MIKWEYVCFKETNISDLTKQMNKYGGAGWELVTINYNHEISGYIYSAVMKRSYK